jgi:hypothetical protein
MKVINSTFQCPFVPKTPRAPIMQQVFFSRWNTLYTQFKIPKVIKHELPQQPLQKSLTLSSSPLCWSLKTCKTSRPLPYSLGTAEVQASRFLWVNRLNQVLSVTTLALGSWPRQKGYNVTGQNEAWESRQEEARELTQEETWESHHILPGVQESVREYEGMNPHTPKAIPI